MVLSAFLLILPFLFESIKKVVNIKINVRLTHLLYSEVLPFLNDVFNPYFQFNYIKVSLDQLVVAWHAFSMFPIKTTFLDK